MNPAERIRWARHRIDPVAWSSEVLGLDLDPKQRELVQSLHRGRSVVARTSRQWGKSTCIALAVAHAMHFDRVPGHPDKHPLALILSPSLRQSQELGRKISAALKTAGADLTENNSLSLSTRTGGRCVLSPAGHTSRGFTPTLVVYEEAAFFADDDALDAVIASGAASRPVEAWISTPNGITGRYADRALKPPAGWLEIVVPATECPRIDPVWLEQQKKLMPQSRFMAEFMCEMSQPEAAFMSGSAIRSIMVSDDTTPTPPPAPRCRSFVVEDVA